MKPVLHKGQRWFLCPKIHSQGIGFKFTLGNQIGESVWQMLDFVDQTGSTKHHFIGAYTNWWNNVVSFDMILLCSNVNV